MRSFSTRRVTRGWLYALALLPLASPYHGDPHTTDDITGSSQLNQGDYRDKRHNEAVDNLKAELNEHPDLTGQTQRDGKAYPSAVAAVGCVRRL